MNQFNAILSFKLLCIKCWCQLVFVQLSSGFAKVVCQSLVETRLLIRCYMLETICRACSSYIDLDSLTLSWLANNSSLFLFLLLMFLPENSFRFVFLVVFVEHHSLKTLYFP